VNATFACEFALPLDVAVLNAIGELYSRVKERLPQRLLLPGITLRVTPQSTQPQPVQVINGVAFSSYARDGQLERQLAARPPLIAFIEYRYMDWESVWAEARELLEMALDVVGAASISGFGLEYQDRFIAEPDSPTPIDFASVLRRESRYLPIMVFDASDVWHATCGTVEQVAVPCQHSLNDSVNIGLIRRSDQAPPQLAVEITIQHRRIFQQAAPPREARQWIDTLFNDMHSRNKAIMYDILTPEMRDRIKLSGGNRQ
jgi:uncharacterized protein (TIGR04255 family)